MKQSEGKIIIPSGVDVWPHELGTARALAAAGFAVEFVRRREGQHEKTPDLLIDGELWEMKSPKGSSMKAVERNLRKALDQSQRIIFDSQRMKGIPDKAVERELAACAAGRVAKIKRLVFVNRRRNVIDIK